MASKTPVVFNNTLKCDILVMFMNYFFVFKVTKILVTT